MNIWTTEDMLLLENNPCLGGNGLTLVLLIVILQMDVRMPFIRYVYYIHIFITEQ